MQQPDARGATDLASEPYSNAPARQPMLDLGPIDSNRRSGWPDLRRRLYRIESE